LTEKKTKQNFAGHSYALCKMPVQWTCHLADLAELVSIPGLRVT